MQENEPLNLNFGTAADEHQRLSVVESPTQPITNCDPAVIKALIEELKHRKMLVSDLKAKGILLAVVPGFNRAINEKHVQELVQSAKDVGGFLMPIQVIDAETYFSYYPDRKLIVDGKEIDRNSPECFRTLVNSDGQHRGEAEDRLIKEGGYTPSLAAEIMNLKGLDPDRWIVEINTQGRTWTSTDRTCYILSSCPEKDSNIFLARELQEEYGMGERAAYAILNLDDSYKRSLQVDYMNNPAKGLPSVLKGTNDKRERGKRILHAFEVGFRHVPKMLKNMAAINLAIEKHKSVDDKDKTKITEELLLFFASLDSEIAKKANDASPVAMKQSILSEEWDRVSKSFSSQLSVSAMKEKADIAEKEWAKLDAERKMSKAKERKKKTSKGSSTTPKINP